MNKQNRSQRGYTLAEVLVALAIFAIIFLAALTAYDRSNRIFRTGVESSNLQQNTRVAFDKLVADLRMAGYDFDRDGIPTGSTGGTNQYQQPDEQFEYVGPAALTIRGNFDYEMENQPCSPTVTDNCDNGREETYETPQFQVVTTGNDEIVTYALVPDTQAAIPACDPATNCVKFFADTHIPRRSYPDIPNGGLDENVVEIPGVDLCMNGCNNPPYTLYRFSLDRSQQVFTNGANVIRTPLASNIRSLQFKYFQDAQGSVPLKDLNNTVDVSTGATIRGLGQYQVGNPLALVPERDIRGKINSVRVTLIGMNESRDAAFTDTAEPIAGAPGYFEQYRKYRLETLVSPRNIQKRGMREQDTYPPGPPTITSVCTGACAGVYLVWDAPAVNAIQGAPDQYKVIYDVATATGFNCETTTFTNTFTHVFGTTPACKLTPNVQYKFRVVALNSYGSAPSTNTVTATPLNTTKPGTPFNLTATNNLNGKVTLNWNRALQNNPPGGYSCGTQVPNPAELLGYIVERQDPVTGTWSQLVTPPAQVTTTSPYDTVTWTDTTAVNCVNYQYRVTAVESCYFDPAYNNPATTTACGAATCGALGISDPSTAAPGNATTTIPPAAPSDLHIDQDLPTICNAVIVGNCDVHMYWPPVTKDATLPISAANPITVNRYKVYRQEAGNPYVLVATLNDPVPNSTTGNPAFGNIEFTDVNLPVGANKTYNYFVVAHSFCPTTPIPTPTPPLVTGDSAPSPIRPYPCPFPAGVTGTPLIVASAFDGDGSAMNPYKISSGTPAVATVTITDGSQIDRVVGRDYIGTTLQWQAQCPDPLGVCTSPTYPSAPGNADATFAWSLAANATERLDIAIVTKTNPGPPQTGGCVMQTSTFFEDEPQNCCLLPASAIKPPNTPVVQFSSTQQFVDIVLKNVCGQPLTINSLSFDIDGSRVLNNSRIVRVDFPTTSGSSCPDPGGPAGSMANCVHYDFTNPGIPLVNAGSQTIAVPQPAGGSGPTSMPSNIAPVPANTPTGTYIIRVVLNSKTNNPTPPITSFTVGYSNASATTTCPVVP